MPIFKPELEAEDSEALPPEDQKAKDLEALLGPSQAEKAADPGAMYLKPEELEKARRDKLDNSRLGAIADNLSNRQSFGNFFLKAMNPHVDASAPFKAANDAIDQKTKNKELLQGQALKAPELDMAQQGMDKSSPYAKAKQDELKMTISALAKFGQLEPDKAQAILGNAENLNAFQADKILGSLKPSVDILKAQGMLGMAGARLQQGERRLGMQQDNQAANAAGKLDSNPIMQSTQRQLNQIGIDRHTIQSAPMITPQMLHEVGNGIAMALSGGKAVGLGMAEMQSLSTLQTKYAEALQKVTNAPQEGASPEIKQQILDTLDRLEDAYKKVQGAMAKQKAVGLNYSHNPAAQQALQQKVDSYQSPEKTQQIKITNPKTGETLMIPPEHLQDAQKDGFEVSK
jgi:hypothetical protein